MKNRKLFLVMLLLPFVILLANCGGGGGGGNTPSFVNPVDLTDNTNDGTDTADNTGGATDNTGGSTDNTGGSTDNTGGSTDNTGGSTDNTATNSQSINSTIKDNTNGTNTPVEGAVITIKDSNGNTILTLPATGSDGNTSFTGNIPSADGTVSAVIVFNYDYNGESKQYTYIVTADSLADLISKLNDGVSIIRNVLDGSVANEDDSNPPSTVKNVTFDVVIKNQDGEIVQGAVLQIVKVTDIVKDSDGTVTSYRETDEVINSMISDSDGKIDWTVPINTAEGYISVIVKAAGYVEAKPVVCKDVSGLDLISGQIILTKESSPTGVDNDGDGILAPNEGTDVDDNNPAVAVINTASYVFAFEDCYDNGTQKGDADFNDAIVKVTYKEYVNAKGLITKLEIITKPLAAGAGYHNKFAIRISGKDYVIYANLHEPFKSAGYSREDWMCNTGKGYNFVDVPEKTTTVDFGDGIAAKDLGSMPFDPFIVPNNEAWRGEVHIPKFNTTYSGKLTDRDNFPWAMVIPEDWEWAYEKSGNNIYDAYPLFQGWYQSNGTVNTDWYLHPNTIFTFKR